MQTSCDSEFALWSESTNGEFLFVQEFKPSCISSHFNWPISSLFFSPEIFTTKIKLISLSASALCEVQIPDSENVLSRKKFLVLSGDTTGPISSITDGKFDDKSNSSGWPFSANRTTLYYHFESKRPFLLGIIAQVACVSNSSLSLLGFSVTSAKWEDLVTINSTSFCSTTKLTVQTALEPIIASQILLKITGNVPIEEVQLLGEIASDSFSRVIPMPKPLLIAGSIGGNLEKAIDLTLVSTTASRVEGSALYWEDPSTRILFSIGTFVTIDHMFAQFSCNTSLTCFLYEDATLIANAVFNAQQSECPNSGLSFDTWYTPNLTVTDIICESVNEIALGELMIFGVPSGGDTSANFFSQMKATYAVTNIAQSRPLRSIITVDSNVVTDGIVLNDSTFDVTKVYNITV